MNVYIPYTRLPSEYQEVEYIQSSGNQIINTGYNITSNMRIVVDFYTPSGTHNNPILGTTYGTWSWTAPMVMNTNEGKLYIATGSGGQYFSGYTTDTKHSLDYNSSRAILDGSTLSISATFNTSYTLTLFYGNSFYGSERIYTCQVYNGDTLVRDLVPCYRKSDSVIGMYDIVNSVFYTNQGTGTFTKGADVYSVEVKNIYIGEYGWKPGSNTIAYYPLKGSMVGEVGGTATLSNGTIGNDYVTLSSGGITAPLTQTLSSSSPFTASIWLYPTYWNGNMRIYNDNNRFRAVIEGNFNTHKIAINWNYEGKGDYSYGTALSLNSWFNIIITYSGSGNTVYIYNNGTKYTYPRGFDTNNSVSSFLVGLGNEAFYGRVADLIVEKSQWDDQTCYDYYNLTKGNYGL